METAGKMATKRPSNFSAGPASLLDGVLEQISSQLEDFEGLGISILEMGHRNEGGPVQRVIKDATSRVRQLLRVPDNYSVLWQQGGAHGQFAAVPLNLLGSKTSADYIDTGVWSKKAMQEAKKFCNVRIAASAEADRYRSIPPISEWKLSEDSAYVHICANDTINSLEFLEDPDIGPEKLLVADFTSTLFSRPVEISKYAAIYCSSGKNLGPAGVCLVIVRNDVLNQARPDTPVILHWKAYADSAPLPSLVNTPPVFAIFACGLVLQELQKKWDRGQGALEALLPRVRARARSVYDAIERSGGFYVNDVIDSCRSQTTICFTFGADANVERNWDGSITSQVKMTELEHKFTEAAKQRGMVGLEGHPAFGGIRVCLYNGVSDEAVEDVVQLMDDFAAQRTARTLSETSTRSSSQSLSDAD
mmetsp:Transcript_93604/g.166541  ORF Transcript_93604/g.166541 Transcript_93604/m.166541 type:complete len:419 (+) Transcript_93604:50-1306(+)